MVRFLLTAIVVAVGISVAAQISRAADAVPKFNTARHCQAELSDSSGTGETMASCVADEQRARDELAPEWNRFSSADKATCIGEVSIDGTPSYVELQTCLENAADVRAKR
jgi:hypothetical protein